MAIVSPLPLIFLRRPRYVFVCSTRFESLHPCDFLTVTVDSRVHHVISYACEVTDLPFFLFSIARCLSSHATLAARVDYTHVEH